ncbi:cytochrome b [Acinetobacter chengduensis]|uniref:Cytochrome b n=3 Tax=Moraxellaceae TaxID=468 RepID=A0ABX9TS40_9GAMM|nr:cytochrome b [Acinetobacter chengduensis]
MMTTSDGIEMMTASEKYPKIMIYAHWLTLVFVLIAYFTSEAHIEDSLGGQVHVIAGGLVFIFFYVRLILLMWFKAQIPTVSYISELQKTAFTLMKGALYTGLFVVPVLGWFTFASTHESFDLLGIELPKVLFIPNVNFGEIHPIIANIFMTLIGLHALAALVHHFILKDGILKSMK